MTLVAVMHGAGDTEVLVPVLRALEAHHEIRIDANRGMETSALAAIGPRARSLRGGRQADGRRLAEKAKEIQPAALVMGLHSNQQIKVAQCLAGEVPLIGVVELIVPNLYSMVRKPKSSFFPALAHMDAVLVAAAHDTAVRAVLEPVRLREMLGLAREVARTHASEKDAKKICSLVTSAEPHLDKRRQLMSIGTMPEVWNDYDLTGDAQASRHVVFIGQHHEGNHDRAQLLRRAATGLGLDFVFLPHPADTREPPEGYLVERQQIAKNRFLSEAAVVVTEYSSLGYTCALAGLRVLYLLPDGPDALAPLPLLMGWAHVRRALDEKDVRRSLRAPIDGTWARGPALSPATDVEGLQAFLRHVGEP